MANNWTFDELTLALYAYCHVPFNRASNTNPWIVKISKIIGRTPAAVKMKIGNLGALDPSLKEKGIVGLTKISTMDQLVWNTYYGNWDQLVVDAENLIHKLKPELSELEIPVGKEELVIVKRRINQNFFRESVISSYNSSCCITRLSNPTLLEACHIVSWTENEKLRLDPSNGLSINPLLHKAYDNFLISIDPDFKIHISDEFLESCRDDNQRIYYHNKNGQSIIMPSRFLPYKECLDLHHQKYRKAL